MVRVRTRVDTFDSDSDIATVFSLIRFFTCGRHQWVVEQDTLSAVERFMDNVGQSPFARTLTALARKAWTSNAAWSSPSGSQTSKIEIEVSQGTLDAAVNDLGRPAIIVVEDLVSDQEFLRAIFHVLGEERSQQALDNGWLEVRHAGGGGRVTTVAEDEAQKFQITARVCAVIDSDSLYPCHRTHAYEVAEHLQAVGIDCHVLTFREIENYIPNRALASIRPYSDHSKKLTALKRLDQAQRAHLDIKKGLGRRAGRFAKTPQQHQDLYADVSEDVLRELEDGFGNSVIFCLTKSVAGLKLDDFAALGTDVNSELKKLTAMIRAQT